ncbi:hypothetical protein BT69DRAFT_706500 [Atractiella rhizophila]|nr:hypothetical protein BT69DRAFT_1038904 [Atractiella rhizophila]KAH8917030.1 hypothetical protein BT69DRAFT_706500 [Atractiella rhizophila]
MRTRHHEDITNIGFGSTRSHRKRSYHFHSGVKHQPAPFLKPEVCYLTSLYRELQNDSHLPRIEDRSHCRRNAYASIIFLLFSS